jgi:hypothetical protein
MLVVTPMSFRIVLDINLRGNEVMKRFLIPALLLAWAVGTAQAASITQNFMAPSQSVPFTYIADASQFNPVLGTLTSVVITATTDINGVVQVINISNSVQTFSNATSAVPVTLSGPNSLGLMVTATTTGQSGSIGAAPSGGFTKISLPGESITASVSTTLTSPVDLAPYIGNGVSDLPFVFTAGAGIFSGSSSANGSVFFGGSADADAKISIVYNYTASPVPEPSSIVLAGIGMVGLGVFGRRRLRAALMG